MTIKELLINAGIAEEQADKIVASMTENKIYTASEENLDVRYGRLKNDHDSKLAELGEANKLIADLQKATKGNEDTQGKIDAYKGQVEQLQEDLQKTKLESALKVGLLAEKAQDIDYLTFKLKEKGELQLDENDKIKGWDDLLSGLKTQFPTQFESGTGGKKVEENKLPNLEGSQTITKEAFAKMGYAQRLEVYKNSPETYNQLTGKGE